jgi:hypothetical protein
MDLGRARCNPGVVIGGAPESCFAPTLLPNRLSSLGLEVQNVQQFRRRHYSDRVVALLLTTKQILIARDDVFCSCGNRTFQNATSSGSSVMTFNCTAG